MVELIDISLVIKTSVIQYIHAKYINYNSQILTILNNLSCYEIV